MNLQDLGRRAARALVEAIAGRHSAGVHVGDVRVVARESTAIVELPETSPGGP
jgi:DNA-binding LacI/PurR family transcriptional regulator